MNINWYAIHDFSAKRRACNYQKLDGRKEFHSEPSMENRYASDLNFKYARMNLERSLTIFSPTLKACLHTFLLFAFHFEFTVL
jgi:hypothetical protein